MMVDQFLTPSGRLSIIGDSPIITAVVLGMLAPYTFVAALIIKKTARLRGGGHWLVAGFAVVLVMGVIGTRSRGPIVAAGITAIVFMFLPRSLLKRTLWSRWHAVAMLLILLLGCLTPTVLTRIHQSTRGDDSVGNRLKIYATAPALVRSTLVSGIGYGQAGPVFSNWYSQEELRSAYSELLSVWLQGAVEWGAIAMAFALAGIALFLATPWFCLEDGNTGQTEAQTITLTVFVAIWIATTYCVLAGITTSLQKSGVVLGLFLLGVLAGSALMHEKFLHKSSVKRRLGLLAGLFALIWVSFVGYAYSGRSATAPLVITPSNIVVIKNTRATGALRALALVDPEVYGLLYGRALRKLLKLNPKIAEMRVVLTEKDFLSQLKQRWDIILIPGALARYCETAQKSAPSLVVVIHPSVVPSRLNQNSRMKIILPQVDELGLRQSWEDVLQLFPAKNMEIMNSGSWGQIMQPCDLQL